MQPPGERSVARPGDGSGVAGGAEAPAGGPEAAAGDPEAAAGDPIGWFGVRSVPAGSSVSLRGAIVPAAARAGHR